MSPLKISIVTPSLNQGAFLEQTIQSVLLQNYPNLEYIVIDGGSTDNSIDILKKYSSHLHYWISEPDRGQSHALNKGFGMASGEILGYLNSDDLLEAGTLEKIAEIFGLGAQWVSGKALNFNGDDIQATRPRDARWPKSLSHFLLPYSLTFAQPSSFWSKEMHSSVGLFNEDIHFCMDREFFLRAGLEGFKPIITSKILSRERLHPNAKKSRLRLQNYKDNLVVIKQWGRATTKLNFIGRLRITFTIYLYLFYEILRNLSHLSHKRSFNALIALFKDYTFWLLKNR